MPPLRELQASFRAALLGSAASSVLETTIATDGLSADARLAIYRHHVTTTLTDVLRTTFPVVARIVDERFFGYAAACFVAAGPPASPCLHEYGAAFPGFLETFEPCRALVYLPDVARLEWAMTRAEHAADATALDTRALAAVPETARLGVRLALHPSLTLLASPWPVDRIWRANQPDAAPGTTVDLDAGGVHLEVRRDDDAVVLRVLDPGVFALRAAVRDGRTLGEAADDALARDPDLDLAAAIAALLHDGSVVALTSTS
jgi:hypothetical protein